MKNKLLKAALTGAIISTCGMLKAVSPVSIDACPSYAMSLKQLIRTSGSTLGIPGAPAGPIGYTKFKFLPIDADVYTDMSEDKKTQCCVYAEIRDVTVDLEIESCKYLTWPNASMCCKSGRDEWNRVKDNIIPHEWEHQNICLYFPTCIPVENIKTEMKSYKPESCKDTWSESGEDIKKQVQEYIDTKNAEIYGELLGQHEAHDNYDPSEDVQASQCTCRF